MRRATRRSTPQKCGEGANICERSLASMHNCHEQNATSPCDSHQGLRTLTEDPQKNCRSRRGLLCRIHHTGARLNRLVTCIECLDEAAARSVRRHGFDARASRRIGSGDHSIRALHGHHQFRGYGRVAAHERDQRLRRRHVEHASARGNPGRRLDRCRVSLLGRLGRYRRLERHAERPGCCGAAHVRGDVQQRRSESSVLRRVRRHHEPHHGQRRADVLGAHRDDERRALRQQCRGGRVERHRDLRQLKRAPARRQRVRWFAVLPRQCVDVESRRLPHSAEQLRRPNDDRRVGRRSRQLHADERLQRGAALQRRGRRRRHRRRGQ